jgi:CHAD domain-containing protein
MAFHFKKREPVAKAVRRMCRERVDGALEILKDRRRPESVHNVRKEIKKLRSLFRLMRGEIGDKTYHRHNQALRTAAAGLTALRDAQMKLNAFEDLARHFRRQLPSVPFPEIVKALQTDRHNEERNFLKGRSATSVAKILCELREETGALKTDSKGWSAIAPGLTRSYVHGQEALAAIGKDCATEKLHEWRKRVKDLGYHLRLLCRIAPRQLASTIGQLEALGDLLGDDHDLVMLDEFVRKEFKGAGDAATLSGLISLRQKELRLKALKIGRRFYAETPARFNQRIGNYWKIWRGKV